MNLLQNNNGIIRIPFLVKGAIVAPPEMSREKIEAAFQNAGRDIRYLKLPEAQLIREPVIDRKTLKYTREYIYQVMPPVNPREVIETDIRKLVQGLYTLKVGDILDYLGALSSALKQNRKLTAEVREVCRLTTEFPDSFLDAWFAALDSSLDREAARAMIDSELSLWGRPGGEFLDGWVEVPSAVMPGATFSLAQNIFPEGTGSPEYPVKTLIRAMPTRQLHITAGNTPDVPVISALRAVLTKSAAVIKLPSGATLAGALFALAAASAKPLHPITQNLSVVYWQGGDTDIENILFTTGAFDRVVVWGSPETVAAVQSRALFTGTVCLSPRYGVSLIGREAFEGNLEETVIKASADSLIYNQKACSSSLVHYIEGTEEQIDRYARLLCRVLDDWDKSVPQFIPPSTGGQVKRMKRGRYISANWYINTRNGEFISGVVVVPEEFNILDHPMCRLVVVRPVKRLEDALRYLHQGISTAGVYPETQRTALKDQIAARGVSTILPLGQCGRLFAGMPHDGMPILSRLVDWKNA